MPVSYSFITKWRTQAPVHDVWDIIIKPEEWHQWWKAYKPVKIIREEDTNGINGIQEYILKTPGGYKLKFHITITKRTEYQYLEGISKGDLEGTGKWIFKNDNGITDIEIYWDVQTNIAWMNTFAFILKPAFKFNHSLIMKLGAKGLSKKLGVKVVSV